MYLGGLSTCRSSSSVDAGTDKCRDGGIDAYAVMHAGAPASDAAGQSNIDRQQPVSSPAKKRARVCAPHAQTAAPAPSIAAAKVQPHAAPGFRPHSLACAAPVAAAPGLGQQGSNLHWRLYHHQQQRQWQQPGQQQYHGAQHMHAALQLLVGAAQYQQQSVTHAMAHPHDQPALQQHQWVPPVLQQQPLQSIQQQPMTFAVPTCPAASVRVGEQPRYLLGQQSATAVAMQHEPMMTVQQQQQHIMHMLQQGQAASAMAAVHSQQLHVLAAAHRLQQDMMGLQRQGDFKDQRSNAAAGTALQ